MRAVKFVRETRKTNRIYLLNFFVEGAPWEIQSETFESLTDTMGPLLRKDIDLIKILILNGGCWCRNRDET